MVADEKRTSFTLSPEKSIFIKLPEPVEFPDLSTLKKNLNTIASDMEDGVKLDYGPYHDFDYSLDGNSLTFWAESWTSPSTTLPLMAAETSVKKWNGLRWTDWAYTGKTLYSTDNVMAYNFNDPVSLQAGSYYKQFAHFEGYKADYSWYEADGEGSQFTL